MNWDRITDSLEVEFHKCKDEDHERMERIWVLCAKIARHAYNTGQFTPSTKGDRHSTVTKDLRE